LSAVSWADEPLTAFALATTGIDPSESRIVAFASRTVNDGTNAPATTTLVNTPATIPHGATRVHGLTNTDTANGLSPQQALTALTDALRAASRAGHGIVIFHSEWFFATLHAEAAAAGVVLDLPALRIIDPLVIDKHINPARTAGNRTLRSLGFYWGVQQDTYGTAAANADAALRLAWRIGHVYGLVRNMNLGELHDAQAQWDREAAEERETYRASRGRVA